MNYPKEYYKQIKTGKIKVCKEIENFYKRIIKEMDEHPLFEFREDLGNYAVDFIEKFCRHYAGEKAGQLVKLELFQKAFIQLLFGFVEKETGLRRFREYFFEVPRKHGKSFLSGCISVYMLVADEEAGAEIYSAANKLDQAKIVYMVAKNIIEQSSELSALIKSTREGLYFKLTKSIIKALPNESKTLDGLNIHFASMDELHEQRDRNMYDVLKQGMSARLQPILGIITTAGFLREGIYDTLHDYACDVANGIIQDDRILPIIYKLDKEEEWTDPTKWVKANPGLGTIKLFSSIEEGVERAKKDPSYLPTLLTKDFNMRQTLSQSWLPFNAIVNETVVPMDFLKNSYAIGGCDLSATTDLTCATLLIRKPNDANVYVLQKYFLPEERTKKLDFTSSKEAPYRLWNEQGYLELHEGNQVIYSNVTKWFLEMVKEHNIRPLWIGYDRALAGYWVEEMKQYGFQMEKVAQGPFTWSQPMKEMGANFENHKVIYQNNPILRWCLANTAKKSLNKDGIETIQPVKIQSNKRIDGTVSLLNAWVLYVKYMQEYLLYVK